MQNSDRNNLPKVSIVTTVWNLYENGRVETFRQMMESVHNQTYSNIEHVVIDNNSTDKTNDLIQEYVNKGYIAKTCFEKKQGLWHGMNRGILEASGEFINFMNSDDYFYRNDAVELSINAILKAGADWSYGYSNKVDPKTNKILFKWYFEDYATIYNARCPNHQTLFVRTKLLKEQGCFEINDDFPKGAFSDDLSMMRLLFSGHIPAVVPEVLVVYRDGGATTNVGRQGAKHYVKYMRDEFGFYELSENEIDKLFWENHIREIDDFAFENLLNKMTIPAWRKRLVKVYGKDFPEMKIVKNSVTPKKPKISIIVPVYNAECDIRRGICSLINQTFKDIEILCINDGSTDHSLEILNELQNLDARVKIFEQKNSGPATARNVGLKNARGKYIMFMDADDMYCLNMCEEMLKTIESKNVDVVMCNTNTIGTNYGNWPFPFGEGKFEIDCSIRKKINCWLWNKIFKSGIIKQNNICFPDGHKSDDDFFVAAYFMQSKKLYCLDKKLVNHFRCENSIMHIYNSNNPNKNDILDHVYILEKVAQYAKKAYQSSSLDEYIDYITYKFKEQIYYAWRNVGTEIENEFLNALKQCVSKIGAECVPEESLLNALIQNQNKIAVNLLDYFAEQFTNIKRKKYLFQKEITPVFNKDYVPVIFSANNNYCKYLSVALQSIIESSSSDKNYDIIILENDISDENKKILKNQIPSNFSIRFYNMNYIIEKYELKSWFYTGRLAPAAYFRLFIPEILQDYKKCVYLDIDLVVQKDIYELYQDDIDGYFVGAIRDVLQTLDKQEYFKTHLKMKKPENNYFNSGVLLFNLEEIKKQNIMQKFLFFAKINNKLYHDQNVLNAACEGKVKYLSPKWNMITSSLYYKEHHCTPFKAPYEAFCENIGVFVNDENYNILHFATWTKPWSKAYIPMANVWWQYARKSPFYEIILKEFISEKSQSNVSISGLAQSVFAQSLSYKKDKLRYYRYKILSKITFGKMRKRYKQKKKELKMRLKEVKRLLKG